MYQNEFLKKYLSVSLGINVVWSLLSKVCLPVCCSVMSHSLELHGLSRRLLCPWNSPSKNTGVGSHSLPQGIFETLTQAQIFQIAVRVFTI